MKVKILEDGITAKEVNHLGERQSFINKAKWNEAYRADAQWEIAEAALRTFEIRATPIFNEDDAIKEYPKWIPGSIHDAIIIADGGGTIKPTVEILK